MNPMPVVTDKVLLPLGLPYPVSLPSLVLSNYGTGEFLQTPNLKCDDLLFWCSYYSSLYIPVGPLYSAAVLHPLGGLESGEAIPT